MEVNGAGNTCLFLRLVAELSDRFMDQPMNIKFCVNISLEMKHDAFNMMPKANDKICNGIADIPMTEVENTKEDTAHHII
jgi:hypothetical protein